MDADTFDHLSRRIATPGTRRAVVGLLGSALLGGSLGATAKGAPVVIGPETEAGLAENLIDCGTFMVHDRFELTYTLRLRFDKEGNLVKGVEQVSGTDTFINATTGKEIAAPFHNNVLIDFTSDPPLGATAGVIYKVTVPGAGAVFLDVGRIVTDQSGEIIAFQAGPHQFFDGEVDALCAALA
jgi:hypothetical protein